MGIPNFDRCASCGQIHALGDFCATVPAASPTERLQADLAWEREMKEQWRAAAKDYQWLVGQYRELLAEVRNPLVTVEVRD